MSDDLLLVAKCILGILGVMTFVLAAIADELRRARKSVEKGARQ